MRTMCCDHEHILLESVEQVWQSTTVIWPLYKSTCNSRHPQLRTGGFCWSKVSLSACPCWWQLVHAACGEDGRVLLNGVTYTISIQYCLCSIPSPYHTVIVEQIW